MREGRKRDSALCHVRWGRAGEKVLTHRREEIDRNVSPQRFPRSGRAFYGFPNCNELLRHQMEPVTTPQRPTACLG